MYWVWKSCEPRCRAVGSLHASQYLYHHNRTSLLYPFEVRPRIREIFTWSHIIGLAWKLYLSFICLIDVSDYKVCTCYISRYKTITDFYLSLARDGSWSLTEHVRQLKTDLKTWKLVYWRLWGQVRISARIFAGINVNFERDVTVFLSLKTCFLIRLKIFSYAH